MWRPMSSSDETTTTTGIQRAIEAARATWWVWWLRLPVGKAYNTDTVERDQYYECFMSAIYDKHKVKLEYKHGVKYGGRPRPRKRLGGFVVNELALGSARGQYTDHRQCSPGMPPRAT